MFGASPTYVQIMQKAGLRPRDHFDFSHLDSVLVSGSPAMPETFAWFLDAVKADLWVASSSGGTDIAGAFVAGCPLLPVHAGEIQCRALGHDVQAWDDNGQPVTDRVGATLVACEKNPLDAVWADQPPPPSDPARAYPLEMAGETAQAKRERVGKEIARRGADAAVLTLPDSICWLLNIRGSDVPHTPFVLCFAILFADGTVTLFIDSDKVPWDLMKHFGAGVRLDGRGEFPLALGALRGRKVLADPSWASAYIFDRLMQSGATIVRGGQRSGDQRPDPVRHVG